MYVSGIVVKMQIYETEFGQLYIFKTRILDARVYCFIKGRDALLIDCGESEKIVDFLKDNNIENVNIYLTHAHYDHILGIPKVKNNFNTIVYTGVLGKEVMEDPRKNLTAVANVIQRFRTVNNKCNIDDYRFIELYSDTPDVLLQDNEIIKWNGQMIRVIYTPGHSIDSICYILGEKYLFAGDSLVKDGETVLGLPGGNKMVYNEYTVPRLRQMEKEMTVLPGHEEPFILKDALKDKDMM